MPPFLTNIGTKMKVKKRMEVKQLMFIKDTPKIYGLPPYKKFQIIDYKKWDYAWQGMSERTRVKKGIFVHCWGMGEFEIFRIGVDVAIVPYCFYIINYKMPVYLKK
jgi:hypothetical protein